MATVLLSREGPSLSQPRQAPAQECRENRNTDTEYSDAVWLGPSHSTSLGGTGSLLLPELLRGPKRWGVAGKCMKLPHDRQNPGKTEADFGDPWGAGGETSPNQQHPGQWLPIGAQWALQRMWSVWPSPQPVSPGTAGGIKEVV